MVDLLRKHLQLFENRDPNVEYESLADRTIAKLKSHQSATYTKLAQKIQKLSNLEEEVSKLKEEIKDNTKEDIADLFDAADEAKTRVVETLQFIFTLSKTPEPSKTVQYKDILEKLSEKFTPELITMMEGLKETMVKKGAAKSPSLRVKAKESIDHSPSIFSKLKATIIKWGKSYDEKFNKLKQEFAKK